MLGLSNLMPIIILILGLIFYYIAQTKAAALAGNTPAALHSRPNYHGLLSFLAVFMAGLAAYLIILIFGSWFITGSLMSKIQNAQPDIEFIRAQLILSDAKSIARGNIASADDALRQEIAGDYRRLSGLQNAALVLIPAALCVLIGFYQRSKITLDWRARNRSERIIQLFLFACAVIAILTTIGIILSLIFETFNFFNSIGWQVHKYIFGIEWSPLAGVHDGQMDADRVGAIPLFVGTALITLIAMLVAVPVGLLAAIYLSDFASPAVRAWAKPMLEILAGIPTVVYGFFAAITLAPAIRGWGESIGLSVASESALAAGVVMGIMIIPFISSLSDDVINAVPQSLRDGSYGLGATKAETIRQVVLPAALPGIVSAVLLGISRAVGETMIVVMAAGQGANLTVNPLEAVTTVTVQIVMLITGDTDASTAAGPAFTLGFTLFCVTLLLNIVALRIVRKYREAYD
ncbi:MAG: phosphate ABC transporter permease subunit PstC [Pseudomonadota bacterium]